MAVVDLDKADIDLLHLSARITAALRKAGLYTIGQVAGRTAQELADLPNIGPSAVAEIVTRLRSAGITLPKVTRVVLEEESAPVGVARVRAIRPDVSRRVGANIRKLREAREIPRQMLSWEMHRHGFNISEAVLKNMELGMPGKSRRPRWITVDEAEAFSEVLGVPIGELFKDEEA